MDDDVEVESIQNIQRQRLSTYTNNEKRITQDAKYEESDRAEYTDRFIYELLQNAVDEMDGNERSCVRFELTEGELITANTGRPFDISDLEALSLITDTTKGGDDADDGTIGHKGRGFTSVLSITDTPQVHSSVGLDAECSSRRTAELLESELSGSEDAWQGRAPTMAVPFKTDRPEQVNKLIDDGHNTVFRLPLRDGIEVSQIATALREKLQPETLACLPELNKLVVKIDSKRWEYKISREEWSGTAEARIVTVRQDGESPQESTSANRKYVFFDKDGLEQPEELVGISDRLLSDIGDLSVSIGFPLNGEQSELALSPTTDREGGRRQPPIHVFLPTEDRSPIPAILNGLFHVSNARRRLSMPEVARESDGESVNTFLFGELASLIGTEVTTFVNETETSIATLLRCLDVTISEQSTGDGGVGRALREEFVERLREELGETAIIPRLSKTAAGETLDEREWVPPTDIVVPHTNDRGSEPESESPGLGPLVALLYGPQEVDHPAVDDIGWFPRQSLLTPELTGILEAMGSVTLEPEHTPELLDRVPDSRAILQYTDDDARLTVDPILHAVGLTWLGLTGKAKKEKFQHACRQSRIIPVGSRQTTDDGQNYYVHVASNGDDDLFLPPARSVPSERLDGVSLLPYELYYLPGGALQSKRARREYLDGSFETLLKSVLNHKPFGFNEVYNRAIAPSLPGPNSSATDELIPDDDATIVNLLFDLARGRTRTVYDGEKPLPYEYRSKTRYFNLCLLPLPIKGEIEWARAHEVYFGQEWQPDVSEATQVESLFEAASIDQAPLLAAPEVFGVDPEDEDELAEAKDFFRWMGVTGHIRVTPFFHPQARHEYGETKHLSAGPESVVDSGSETLANWRGVNDISEEDWEEYRAIVEARLEERARGDESFYIWQISRLEYADDLTDAANTEPDVARMLLSHIDEWWTSLERFADASLVLWTNKTFGARSSYLYKEDEEIENVPPNLWLWELQQSSWLPTEHGRQPPGESWLLSDEEIVRAFSVATKDDSRQLLPLVTDDPIREVLTHRDGLTKRLGIRQALKRSSFDPADARSVSEALASVFTGREEAIRARLQELRSTYAKLGKTLPGLTQSGKIDEEGWYPSETRLDTTEVLCRQGNSYRFVPASEAYFVRDSAAADRYRDLDVPIFILHRDEVARFAAYFDIKDLEDRIETEVRPGETRTKETNKLTGNFLQEIAPAILCRLQATRESEEMRKQDIGRLSDFLRDLQIVSSLNIEYTLRSNPKLASVRDQREVHVDRADGDAPNTIYVATKADDVLEDLPLEALSRALSEHLEFPNWEPLYVLLQRGPERGPVVDHLRTTGAPYRQEVFEENRRLLTDDPIKNSESKFELGEVDRSGQQEFEESSEPSDEEDSSEQQSSRTNQVSPSGQIGSVVPKPEQLEQVGQREEFEQEPTDNSRSNSGRPGNRSGGGGSSNNIVTADYIDRIDKFGMAATMQAERNRIADECENPQEYVHDIHTGDLYREAKEHEIAGPALERLEKETRITEPYPGFDILVVSREEKAMPERCIELKSSSKNIRRPSITWNEWKSAKDSWLRERYYLYVARELQTGKSGESTLLQIQNPFERLRSRTRTRRTEEREVQVRLDRIDGGGEPVYRQPIYWEEDM
jgi:hypothetical protein